MKVFKRVAGIILGIFILAVELAVILPVGFAVWLTLFAVNGVVWILKKSARIAGDWTDHDLGVEVVGFVGLDIRD